MILMMMMMMMMMVMVMTNDEPWRIYSAFYSNRDVENKDCLPGSRL